MPRLSQRANPFRCVVKPLLTNNTLRPVPRVASTTGCSLRDSSCRPAAHIDNCRDTATRVVHAVSPSGISASAPTTFEGAIHVGEQRIATAVIRRLFHVEHRPSAVFRRSNVRCASPAVYLDFRRLTAMNSSPAVPTNSRRFVVPARFQRMHVQWPEPPRKRFVLFLRQMLIAKISNDNIDKRAFITCLRVTSLLVVPQHRHVRRSVATSGLGHPVRNSDFTVRC